MTKNKITASDKKRITSDWNQMIPSLGIYKPMHLINRIGPLLVGILLEVKSGNEKYIPTFHVHNLLRPFQVISLGLNFEITPITIGSHESKYYDSAMKMVEQAIVPFEGDLDLSTILNAYEQYFQKNIGGPILPYIFEDIVLLSAWCEDKERINKGLQLAEANMRGWPEHILNRLGGLDNWLISLKNNAENRGELISILENQIAELKVDNLPIRRLSCY